MKVLAGGRVLTVHPDVTIDVLLMATEESMFGMTDSGFCIACGTETIHVEPDARMYECDVCGEHAVFGAEELLMEVAG